MEYHLNDIVQLKKEHACHKSKYWQITRMGVDIKIRCLGCDRVVMMERIDFEKNLKKIIEVAKVEE
ncbi:MAG: DUF951 domain-containing protein [Erysipelotrichaceae bacterium]|nr:DUF951 domain-containing protein [Erysipelotrichaceae bacterium]